MVFRYRLLPVSETEQVLAGAESIRSRGGLMALYGICADMYREVGGAEAFIRSQRENFGSIADIPESVEAPRR
jgi:hypothetical protein